MAWMQWWSRRRPEADAVLAALPAAGLRLPGSLAAPEPAAPPRTEAAVPPPAALRRIDRPEDRATYLTWLLPLPALPRRSDPRAAERALAALDTALDSRDGWARLVGRAPNIVPRLMNTLRSLAWSRADVAGLIERDALLTAEVLRLARSSLFAHLLRGRAPTLSQAIDLLGSEGLQDAVARVLMHPLFVADGTGLRARAAARLQDESERCARLVVALAPRSDPVDAYLAGLLLGVGWSAVLKALELDRIEPLLHRGLLARPAFATALLARRDRLLGRLVAAWNLSEPLNRLALLLDDPELPGIEEPLHGALRQAQELLVLRRLQLAGEVPGGLAAPAGLPPAAATAYLAD